MGWIGHLVLFNLETYLQQKVNILKSLLSIGLGLVFSF
jgi:hypothetical protein